MDHRVVTTPSIWSALSCFAICRFRLCTNVLLNLAALSFARIESAILFIVLRSPIQPVNLKLSSNSVTDKHVAAGMRRVRAELCRIVYVFLLNFSSSLTNNVVDSLDKWYFPSVGFHSVLWLFWVFILHSNKCSSVTHSCSETGRKRITWIVKCELLSRWGRGG